MSHVYQELNPGPFERKASMMITTNLSVLINDVLKGAATLLNQNWAITAAVNVFIIFFTVFLYLNTSTTSDQVTIRSASNNAFSGGNTTTLKEIVFHPNYGGLWKDDLALIKLATPANFSEGVKSISIAKSLPKQGTNAVVVGWGPKSYFSTTDGILREAVVPVMNYETCKQKYYPIFLFTDTSFCTAKDNVGPCPHDFGDPLVYKNKVIGIFSGSFDCGSTTYPAVYADVTQYNKWINKVIKS
ncbi:trypsin-like [Lycorma delicatula]|uniref:trypsin-like n=1 Tax=Lycorma delicatula TaxID=130591 RepID=UPI003F50D80F